MLKDKAEQEGKIYQEVDRFFPSSKTCHVCLDQIDSLPLASLIISTACFHCASSSLVKYRTKTLVSSPITSTLSDCLFHIC